MRWAVLTVVAVSLAWAAPPPKRPTVDLQAMREAMGSNDPDAERFSSAASYAHFLNSRIRHHSGDHRGALDELRLALASDDGSPTLMMALAEAHAHLGQLDRAERQLQRVLEQAPALASAHLLMGRVLLEATSRPGPGPTWTARSGSSRRIPTPTWS